MEYTPDIMDQAYQQSNLMGEGNDPNSLYADVMQRENIRNIIEQINPDLLLEDIEHRIRGEIKDRYTKEWRTLGQGTKVSETLIAKYISFLGSILNQNTALSNFSSKEINNLMSLITEHIGCDLADNSRDYGFTKINKIILTKEIKLLKPIDNNGLITYQYIPMTVEEELETEVQTDYNEMTRIANIISMATFAVLKRAQNGMEARRLFNTFKLNESQSIQPNKKSALDALAFWK